MQIVRGDILIPELIPNVIPFVRGGGGQDPFSLAYPSISELAFLVIIGFQKCDSAVLIWQADPGRQIIVTNHQMKTRLTANSSQTIHVPAGV